MGRGVRAWIAAVWGGRGRARRCLWIFLGVWTCLGAARAEPAGALEPGAAIHGYVDLHIHLAAHLAVPAYGSGIERDPPARQTERHALDAQIFLSQLVSPGGPAIYLSLAYANPFNAELISDAAMRAHILRQLDYVDGLCARHPDRLGCARTPEEARYWAARGVAVITPIHLADNHIGAALCQEGMRVLNLPGCRQERRDPEGRGLTVAGRARILDLVDAGIVVDLAHMARPAFAQAVGLLEGRGAAPVHTHAIAAAIRDAPGALSDAEIGRLYAAGGCSG